MDIRFTNSFSKAYQKLSDRDKLRVDEAIRLFRSDPFFWKLSNHKLQGTMKGKRAISAGFDLRIIFEERDGYMIVLMLDVGKHEGVY